MMSNEPCDRRSRCLTYGSHGLPHVIPQTPQHHAPGGNTYPLHHPTTPMMNVHKATPSVVVPHHAGSDLYCQDQCCATTYAAPKHQYHHAVDPRYTGTLSRKFVNPSAQRVWCITMPFCHLEVQDSVIFPEGVDKLNHVFIGHQFWSKNVDISFNNPKNNVLAFWFFKWLYTIGLIFRI